MKMQNTDIEFVTFDSGDVITTSGGLFGYYGIMANDSGNIATTSFMNTHVVSSSILNSIGPNSLQGHASEYSLGQSTGFDEGIMYVVTGVTGTSGTTRFYFTYTPEKEFKKTYSALTENLYVKGSTTMDEVIDWLILFAAYDNQ